MIKVLRTTVLGFFLIGSLDAECSGTFQTNNSTSFNSPSSEQSDISVLQIMLNDSIILSDGIISYKVGEDIFIPLSDFTSSLMFPISVSKDGREASGWFIDDKRAFSLDIERGEVISGKKKYKISKNSAFIAKNTLYCNSKELEKWFGFKTSYNSYEQILNIESSDKFPIQKKMERDGSWNQILERKVLDQESDNERRKMKVHKTPYKMASVPLVDMTFKQNINKSSQGDSVSSSQVDLVANADFAYMSNKIFANVNNNKSSNFKITSGRSDPDGELLGPLHAKQFWVGDVYSTEAALVSMGREGRGAMVTNYPEEYVSEFNKTQIRGNIQPGWEVELYRDSSLLDFQVVGQNGIYDFKDVNLTYGLNIIRLVFYGPFGQKREEIRRFLVNNEMVKKGGVYYKFLTNKHDENLINLKGGDSDRSNDPRKGSDRFFGEMSYGLLESTSVAANFSRIPVIQYSDGVNKVEAHDYVTSGIRSSMLGVYGSFDFVNDITDETSAYRAVMQTNIRDYNLNLQYDYYQKKFISEEHIYLSDPIVRRLKTRIDTPTYGTFGFPLRLSFDGTREYFESGLSRTQISAELPISISNKLNFNQSIVKIADERFAGSSSFADFTTRTIINYRVSDKLMMRGSLTYDLSPVKRLSSSSVSAEYRADQTLNINAGINRQSFYSDVSVEGMKTTSLTSYNVNFSKALNDKYIASLGCTYGSDKSYSMSLNLSMSFGYDPKYNTVIRSGVPIANTPTVLARAFIDENMNGKLDGKEELLRDIEFETDGSGSNKTNKSGVAHIGYVNPSAPVRLKIIKDSIPDLYLTPKDESFMILARRGAISNFEFALIRTGEIEGFAKTKSGSEESFADSVRVELVDAKTRKIIKTVVSASDGFYLFDKIPLGKYSVRISSKERKSLGASSLSRKTVSITKNKPVFSDADVFAVLKSVNTDIAQTEPTNFETKLLPESKPVEVSKQDKEILVSQLLPEPVKSTPKQAPKVNKKNIGASTFIGRLKDSSRFFKYQVSKK